MKIFKDKKGQAALEFVVVFMVALFFLLFFLSMAVVMVVSNYMDYATFMAARTYKAADETQDDQKRFAEDVFRSYTDKVEGIAKNISALEFVHTNPGNEQTAGVRTEYEIDLFYLPPVFSKVLPDGRLRLTAESYLGRDPSYAECNGFFSNFMNRFNLDPGLAGQMDDNGC